jgi:hypothetical protein
MDAVHHPHEPARPDVRLDVLRHGGCRCEPPGSGEEYCTGHCELRAALASAETECDRLRSALGVTCDALRFYRAEHADPSDARPWVFDDERKRWYFTGEHPADVADFALRKASLAERGKPPPFDDYVGRAKAAALGVAYVVVEQQFPDATAQEK